MVRVLHRAAYVSHSPVEAAQVNCLQGAIVVADKQLQAVLVKRKTTDSISMLDLCKGLLR